MAASPIVENITNPSTSVTAKLLVCLPSLPADALERVRANVAAFLTETVLIASPEAVPGKCDLQQCLASLPMPTHGSNSCWVLTAGDYLAATDLALSTNAETVVLLGDHEISTTLLENFVAEIRTNHADLVLPRYTTNPTDGLVNSALLYPLTHVLFGVDVRFPLPLNAAFSRRAAERLSPLATRLAANGAPDSLLWPVAEAAAASLHVCQIDAGERSLPQPSESDFNSLFAAVSGSLFADIEAKAAFWQRTRSFYFPSRPAAASAANHLEEAS